MHYFRVQEIQFHLLSLKIAVVRASFVSQIFGENPSSDPSGSINRSIEIGLWHTNLLTAKNFNPSAVMPTYFSWNLISGTTAADR